MRKWVTPIAFIGLLLCLTGLRSVAAQAAQYDLLYATQSQDGNDYQLRVVNAASGKSRDIETLIGEGSDAGWSPKGDFIYLVNGAESQARSLTLVNMEDGSRQLVTSQFSPNICGTPLWWSPDDRYLAFIAGSVDPISVNIFDAQDNTLQTLSSAGDGYLNPALWSPGGRYFTYAPDTSPQSAILIWDAEEKQIRAQLETDQAVWSPDDGRIAYMDNERDIVVMNIVDSSEQHYEGTAIVGWSADGRFLNLYDEQFDQLPSRISSWVDTSGKDAPLVWELGAQETDGSLLSPDGRYVVYETAGTEQSSTAVLDMTTGNTTKLVGGDLSDAYRARWSSNAYWLAVPALSNGQTVSGFWVFDIDGRKQQQFDLTVLDNMIGSPLRWSPDGGHLMVWIENGIAIFDRQQWVVRKLDNIPGGITAPHWSPDGQYLAITTYDGGNTDIDALDTGSLEVQNLTNSPKDGDTFVGWRGSGENRSLINCGEG